MLNGPNYEKWETLHANRLMVFNKSIQLNIAYLEFVVQNSGKIELRKKMCQL